MKKLQPTGYNKEQIRNFANEIAIALNITPGCKLESIVERLGGTITQTNSWGTDGTIQTSPEKTNTGSKKFEIKLGALFPLAERHIIARELGRYFLHSRMGDIPISHKDDYDNSAFLWEAETFASAFLIPTKQFKNTIKNWKCTTESSLYNSMISLAAHFYVPYPIMEYKVRDYLEEQNKIKKRRKKNYLLKKCSNYN